MKPPERKVHGSKSKWNRELLSPNLPKPSTSQVRCHATFSFNSWRKIATMWVQRRVPLIEPLIFLAILWAPDLAGEAAVLAAKEAKAVGQGQDAGKLLLLAGHWGRGLMSGAPNIVVE